MMITIFLFAFSWQWTDNFYTDLFFTQSGALLMPRIVKVPQTLANAEFTAQDLYESCIKNTCGLMIILPLLLFYSYMQKYLIQGIERSGIVG
jgi:multiple sugar transport system permease protein